MKVWSANLLGESEKTSKCWGAEHPAGRGLWCRTNMEAAFASEAQRAADEKPSDADLPALPSPDMLSCLMSAPGVRWCPMD